MRDYKNYTVWQESIELTSEVYELTKKFPDDEKFGLISQIRRSAVSIPSNIAEGASRSSIKDFSRFLEVAQGSGFELDTQLLIAENLNLISEMEYDSVNKKLISIGKQIAGLKKSLKEQS